MGSGQEATATVENDRHATSLHGSHQIRIIGMRRGIKKNEDTLQEYPTTIVLNTYHVQVAQKEILVFYPSSSNAIILHDKHASK